MAESVTQQVYKAGKLTIVQLDVVTAADGSLTNTALDAYIQKAIRGKKCILGVTNPGSTAPTDNYDLTVLDGESCDIFGGELANRDTANSEQAIPKAGNSYGGRPIDTNLTLTLANNSVNSATLRLKLYFEE